MEQCQSFESDHTWPASLSCRFHKTSAGKTALAELSHAGPLRVQKLFHDQDLAHCYVLHPPGGWCRVMISIAGSISIPGPRF